MVPLSAWAILAACMLASLLNEVSAAVLNLAMPIAARDVGAAPSASQIILLAAKLSMGPLLLAGGALGDRFGRKRTMVVGITLVAIASVASGLAQTAGLLGAARALDGIGNALVGPLALAIAVVSFPDERRAQVVGLFLGVSGLGIAIGPLVAGFLVQAGGWRVGFAAPLTFAVAAGAAITVLAPQEAPHERRPPSDVVGMLSCVIGLVALVLGFVLAGRDGWLAAKTLGLLGGGMVVLGFFGWWETARAATPLLDPALLRSREVMAALVAATLAALVLNGTVLPLLYFLQRVHGAGPVESVLRLLPLVAAALAVAPFAGSLAERRGRRGIMAGGLLLMAAGCALMAPLTPQTAYGIILLALMLMGAGMMLVITPAADLVIATTGPQRMGSAAALNSAVAQVGGAIGIGVITSAFMDSAMVRFTASLAERGYTREQVAEPARRLREIVRDTALKQIPQLPDIAPQIQRDLLDSYVQAFAAGVGRSFLLAALLALAGVLVVLVGMKPIGPRPPAAAADPAFPPDAGGTRFG